MEKGFKKARSSSPLLCPKDFYEGEDLGEANQPSNNSATINTNNSAIHKSGLIRC